MNKIDIDVKIKEKWKYLLTTDMMTSEESGEDDEVIIVKPLSWRSRKVSKFFHKLDVTSTENKTSQAKRQRKQRVLSDEPSMRPQPPIEKYSRAKWAFVTD